MFTTLKIAILATMFILTGGAVFRDWFRKHRFIAAMAACVAIISSIYLGRSIYDDFKSEIINDMSQKPGPSTTARPNPNAKLTESPYYSSIPREFTTGDQWGRFYMDGNCTLRYGNSVIHQFRFVGKGSNGACEYFPEFSPSPSLNKVAVFVPTDNYGHSNIALIDTVQNYIQMPLTYFDSGFKQGFLPYDTWSSSEEGFLIGRVSHGGGFAPGKHGNHVVAIGEQPCVFNIASEEVNCLNAEYFIEQLSKFARTVIPGSVCIVQKSCFLMYFIESSVYHPTRGTYESRVRLEVSRYSNRQSDEPLIGRAFVAVEINGDGYLVRISGT